MPEALSLKHMIQRHGKLLGHVILWYNRARTRHQLDQLAQHATDERFDDIGVSRAAIAREAARWFWEEMGLS